MKEYLSSVLLTAAIAALFSLIAPEGKTRRYVSFALSSAVLLALLAPLGAGDLSELIPELPIVSDGETAEASPVTEMAEQALAEAIAEELSLPLSGITVEISEACDGVEVGLDRELASYLAAVSQFVRREVKGECEVKLNEG